MARRELRPRQRAPFRDLPRPLGGDPAAGSGFCRILLGELKQLDARGADDALAAVREADEELALAVVVWRADEHDAVDASSAAPWTIEGTPPDDTNPESHLEQRFRKVIIARLRALGATITEVPGAWGNTVKFVLTDSPRQWTLRPQVHLENSKPDFVLQSNDPGLPAVAIFTDGHPLLTPGK